MTRHHDPDFDQRIADWLEEDPSIGPREVLGTVLAAYQSIPQRRALRAPWRNLSMNRLSAAITVAAVGALAVGALLLAQLPSAGQVGGPPTPSPAASPTTTPDKTTIDATAFGAPFTMTWNTAVTPDVVKSDAVEIHVRGGTGFNMFVVNHVGKDPCTTNDPSATTPTTPQAFMDWLATVPRTTALPVASVTIGGRPGLSRQVDIGDLTGCIDTEELHSGITSKADTVPGGFFMVRGDREQWFATSVGGKLVVFTIWPLDDTAYVTLANQAISTITFK